MEIDNHILSLSMEFERQNIIINEYETMKAKNTHDRTWRKRKSHSAKKSSNRPKSGGQQQVCSEKIHTFLVVQKLDRPKHGLI